MDLIQQRTLIIELIELIDIFHHEILDSVQHPQYASMSEEKD